jgi:hypothetical protein
MLVMNLDQNSHIKVEQIGWSLWIAIGCSGGYLSSFVLFCIHRGLLKYSKEEQCNNTGLRKSSMNSSKYFLQTF